MTKKSEMLLTPTTAAKKFGLPRGKIYNWIRNRRFEFIKPDKEVLFWERDFIEFLNSNIVPATSEEDCK